MEKKFIVGAFILALVSLSSAAVATPMAALSFTGGSAVTGLPLPATVGWKFTTGSNALSVTELGFYDHAGDKKLNDDHEVGIFTVGSSLLASTTITSSSSLEGDFLYESLGTALTLAANTTYHIGAFMPTADDVIIGLASATTASDISYLNASFTPGSILSNPSNNIGADHGLFGPNFKFEVVSSVPAPSVLVFLVLGMVFLLGKKAGNANSEVVC
ncbi:MAG: DUF4082 domain-containing protein [Methyloprofundus sp.]|nr:DUF4082 domain-containing protein [Methyloprofundus sp.]